MTAPSYSELRAAASASTVPTFNIGAAVHRCGVPAPTIRAWERRHGFPAPGRGPGRHRLYSERDVRLLAWLRDRISEGLTISAALGMCRQGIAALETAEAPIVSANRSAAANADALRDALMAFDGDAANAVLAEAFGLYPVEHVCLAVIAPALATIGAEWEAGSIDVAQEHFASGYIRHRLTTLLDVSNAANRDRMVVCACAPDDWHELGLLMVAVFLARRGWHVVYLGASVPAEGLAARLHQLRPTALVLSASTGSAATALVPLTEGLAGAAEAGLVIAYGGQVFERSPQLRQGIRAIYLGPSADVAVRTLEQSVGG